MSGTTKITAESNIEQLPDDVATLKQMVLTLPGQIDDLQGQLYYLKRQLFGKKSEKLNPAQRLLFENLYNEIEAKIEQQNHPKAEPTNNGTERQIRPVVIDRRITQGTRGQAGIRWCERIWTVLATCRKQQRNVFDFIHESVIAHWNNKKYPSLLC